jgi:hypothetical protein
VSSRLLLLLLLLLLVLLVLLLLLGTDSFQLHPLLHLTTQLPSR